MDGIISSWNIYFPDGFRKTLGFMSPRENEFSTGERETMEILAGKVTVLLPDSEYRVPDNSEQTFDVLANIRFKLKLLVPVVYCCSFG